MAAPFGCLGIQTSKSRRHPKLKLLKSLSHMSGCLDEKSFEFEIFERFEILGLSVKLTRSLEFLFGIPSDLKV